MDEGFYVTGYNFFERNEDCPHYAQSSLVIIRPEISVEKKLARMVSLGLFANFREKKLK